MTSWETVKVKIVPAEAIREGDLVAINDRGEMIKWYVGCAFQCIGSLPPGSHIEGKFMVVPAYWHHEIGRH